MVARILLLEGAAEREESLAPRLSAEGFDVLAEKDPAKGVQMASEKQPDVIVINGRLPGCSASDIVKQLHTAEPTGLLPVVQIVDSTPQDPQALLDDGADDYLARPLDWPAFLALLSARTRRWREWNAFYNRRIEQTRSKVVQALSHEVFYPAARDRSERRVSRSQRGGRRRIRGGGYRARDRLGGAQAAPHVGQADARRHA